MLVLLVASPAGAYLVGPPVPLEELAKKADLVCKATVLSDHPVTDTWFDVIAGYEVRETEMRVVPGARPWMCSVPAKMVVTPGKLTVRPPGSAAAALIVAIATLSTSANTVAGDAGAGADSR